MFHPVVGLIRGLPLFLHGFFRLSDLCCQGISEHAFELFESLKDMGSLLSFLFAAAGIYYYSTLSPVLARLYPVLEEALDEFSISVQVRMKLVPGQALTKKTITICQ